MSRLPAYAVQLLKQRASAAHSSWIRSSVGLMVVFIFPVMLCAGSVQIMAATDQSLCEKVAKWFGDRLAPDADLLKTVKWTSVELKGQGPKTRHCSNLEKAIIDFDNNGQLDLLVKTTFCMKGAPSDSFYVFPADSHVLEQASWQDMAPLLATPDRFERTGGSYPLTALPIEKAVSPSPLTTLFDLRPFVLDGVSYVSLTDVRREWMVIAKYVGGERFDDQCYLQSSRF